MILVCTRNASRPLRIVECVGVNGHNVVYARIDGVPRAIEVHPQTPVIEVEKQLARAVSDAELAASL